MAVKKKVAPRHQRARLSLEEESPQKFNILAIDAFSGDTIPVHLLTQEALELYLDKLAARGILAFHISNQFLDLEPVIASLAELPALLLPESHLP